MSIENRLERLAMARHTQVGEFMENNVVEAALRLLSQLGVESNVVVELTCQLTDGDLRVRAKQRQDLFAADRCLTRGGARDLLPPGFFLSFFLSFFRSD